MLDHSSHAAQVPPLLKRIGKYSVLRTLGHGGMAAVYLAKDPVISREVAIKILRVDLLNEKGIRDRFLREANAVASLDHPCIVPVYDYGEEAGQPFLVMRCMPGGSLAAQIRIAPLSHPDAARVLQRIGAALDAAHARGIVHRDLKPSNILYDQYGEVFLSDFGIAQLSESAASLTGSGIIGTPAYMSPEQARAESKVDGRSDVYSLGVVLYEMLTGTVPFKAETPIQQILMHLQSPAPKLSEKRPDLPSGFDEVVERAMAKNPSERYEKGSELSRAFSERASVIAYTPSADIPFASTPSLEQTELVSMGTADQPTAVEPVAPSLAFSECPTEIDSGGNLRAPSEPPAAKENGTPPPGLSFDSPAMGKRKNPLWKIAAPAAVAVCLLAVSITFGALRIPSRQPVLVAGRTPSSSETARATPTPQTSASPTHETGAIPQNAMERIPAFWDTGRIIILAAVAAFAILSYSLTPEPSRSRYRTLTRSLRRGLTLAILASPLCLTGWMLWQWGQPMDAEPFRGLSYYEFNQWRWREYRTAVANWYAAHPVQNGKPIGPVGCYESAIASDIPRSLFALSDALTLPPTNLSDTYFDSWQDRFEEKLWKSLQYAHDHPSDPECAISIAVPTIAEWTELRKVHPPDWPEGVDSPWEWLESKLTRTN